MPIKSITPTLPLGKKAVSSDDTPASFAGKQVRLADQQESIAKIKSYSEYDENKSIRDRSVLYGSDNASFITSDERSETDSFHSTAEFLEDKFPTDNATTSSTSGNEPWQISSTDYHQATGISEETVKHLEDADCERLHQYIENFTNVYEETGKTHGIATDLKEPLLAMMNYGERLNADMQRLEILGQKLQNQGLSKRESIEMKALMHCNKYNLSFAQGWLSATMALEVSAGKMNEPTATLLTALSNRLAKQHMNLADTISLYEDRLPAREPLSRRDRIEYNLLTARAGLRAFNTMMRSQKGIHRETFIKMKRTRWSLEKHCAELEYAAKLARGKVKMDANNPKLELESPDAWTENFDLIKNKEQIALPQQAAEQLVGNWNKTPPVLALSHPNLSQRDMTRLFITFQLKKEGVDIAQLPKFEAAYEQALITEINQGKWPVIDRPLQFNINGKKHSCRSTITPGTHLAKRFEKPYKSNGISYADRLQVDHVPNMAHTRLVDEDGETLFSGVRHGILDAYDYSDKSVRNFSDIQLTGMAKAIYDDEQSRVYGRDTATLERQLQALEETEDDGESITVFTRRRDRSNNTVDEPVVVSKKSINMRHLEKQIELRNEHAREIVEKIKSNPKRRAHYINEMRNLASRKMAREVLSAAIVSEPAKLQAALDGETVDVTMNSVALVTPDWLRHIGGIAKDERRMLKHQIQGLRSLASGQSPDKPVRLTIKDDNQQPKEIKVNLKVRTFNFGVNNYALARTVLPANFPIWRSLMGWGFSAGLNDPQLSELLGARNNGALGGAVVDKLQELEQSDDPKVQKRAVLLREAATQVKQIWKNRSFWSGNNEPYKMVSRLALTSHLMGETPLFNCKSGKDRTGQLDAEVKYLAAVGHATGHIPEPDSDHTAESRKMRTTFTLDAGNLELQRMNTGLTGYKLRNIPGLQAMLEEGSKAKYEGGSDFV